MSNKAKEATNFMTTFAVTAAVIIAAALLAARLFGLQGFTVESNSMAPAYPVDSFVLVKNTAPESIKPGDVITYVFNNEGLLVTHRVVSADADNHTFKTKGDNNNAPDASPVLWENVVGKVVFGVPKVGSVLRVIMKKSNRPYVITAIAATGIASVAVDLTEKKKKSKVKNDEES